MDAEKLKRLLYQDESATLDFKREWYKIDDSNGETKKDNDQNSSPHTHIVRGDYYGCQEHGA